MFSVYLYTLLLVLAVVSVVKNEEEKLSPSFRRFLGTLEQYENTRNDVVFLLDDSGSIGADKFPEVKNFSKLIAQRLSVSSEYSRIALLTFSTGTQLYANYINEPDGNNMCTLNKDIDKIEYTAGWTHTDVGMKVSGEILDGARPNSYKIIILLTDGQSNPGHSPVEVSKNLKRKGVIIFAIGVSEVNEKEIDDVATSKNHTYILDNFDKIKDTNVLLVKDLSDPVLDIEDSSSCQFSCDMNAKCYCGARTGKHECICDAGYFGAGGYEGQCHKCPKGTFKEKSSKLNCTACPEHSTTKIEGSIDFDDCECEIGYNKAGKVCSPVRCATLTAPEGGILIPNHCGNTYGSHCSFECHKGYCPFSCTSYTAAHFSSPRNRTCLETGRWSNEDFFCEKMTCPALNVIQNGHYKCTSKGFTNGTTCNFECEKGYRLFGSKSRTCVFGVWTGQDVECKEISCEKLHSNALLIVKPEECSKQDMPYRSICKYTCVDGYELKLKEKKVNGILECGPYKKWSLDYSKFSCEDSKPPEIKCPGSITVDTEPDQDFAHVSWDSPNATDNVRVVNIRLIHPKNFKKPYRFPINSTKVVYKAVDSSKNNNTCSFLVTVIDKEPPKVLNCPTDIEIYHDNKTAIPVTWTGPQFKDNSGIVSYTSNRKSGDAFSWGPPSVVYFNASDPSNNTASCSFKIVIKPHSCPYHNPPANGILTCDKWNHGRLCSVFCHDGYKFAVGKNFHHLYTCIPNGKEWKWQPFRRGGFKWPWPDCSRIQLPVALNTSSTISYTVDSCRDEVLQRMREDFFKIAKTLPKVLCPENRGCEPKNIAVTCNPITSRKKRNLGNDVDYLNDHPFFNHRNKFHRDIRETVRQQLSIRFDITFFPNDTHENPYEYGTNEFEKEKEMNFSSNYVLKELENKISLVVKDFYNVTSLPQPKVNHEFIAICSTGQISVNNSCVNCPAGTYKDDVSGTCIDCPQASYQDEERQLSCKPCPLGYTTYEVKSKLRSDCKGPCEPGTYSKTAFEPCLSCPRHTYQDRSTRKECLKCPSGLYTWRVGANSSTDCVAPCKPGSFSDTGYEPCTVCDIGSFQDKEMQKECESCPNRTSTTTKGSRNMKDCLEIDICDKLRPCMHNSTCIQQDKDYECVCPKGLMGKTCEINFDECTSSPCLNNGSCVDSIGNFTCLCPAGWTGHQCEINVDDCASNPCLNSGQCIDKINAYECYCIPGFTGERCEKNIYECESNPCLNNGTCFDKLNGYRCCCTKDFYGSNCENALETNLCDTMPCLNGGTCLAEKDDFNCSCPSGFEGKFCEFNMDDCKDFSCENGGFCVDGIENASCICPKKFAGMHCETVLMPEFLLSFPTPITKNYAQVENSHRLSAITVAFFMRTDFSDPSSRATPVSYSYKYNGELVDNALTFLDINNFVLYIHGQEFHTMYKANKDTYWHHYAVTWEKMFGRWVFYADGIAVETGKAGEDKYMHPGIFVLGQEQDDLGFGFSTLEAFAGDITEFNVWDYALTAEEINRISSSCGYIGNIIPWYVVSQSVHGDVIVSHDVDKCKHLGSCPENSCDCFYTNSTKDYLCKHIVKDCLREHTCLNDQLCITDEFNSFCFCSDGFEGRNCEYDIDECLEMNGGCSHFCVNEFGSHRCECPVDMILSEDGKTCKDTTYCLEDGKRYLDGENWMNFCQNCTCNQGNMQCEGVVCSKTDCQPDETEVFPPGECCPKCIAWGFCLVSPNDTVLSFDMSIYQIEGECIYTALEDCIDGHFKVEIESNQTSTNETKLIIYQSCYKVVVSSTGNVLLDDHAVTLPFTNEELAVDNYDSVITVKTKSDLLVQWNFANEASIAIPVSRINQICGICSRVQDYYVYDTGKFPISDRFASGKGECFIITENFEENTISGSTGIYSSKNVAFVFLIMYCIIKKMLICSY